MGTFFIPIGSGRESTNGGMKGGLLPRPSLLRNGVISRHSGFVQIKAVLRNGVAGLQRRFLPAPGILLRGVLSPESQFLSAPVILGNDVLNLESGSLPGPRLPRSGVLGLQSACFPVPDVLGSSAIRLSVCHSSVVGIVQLSPCTVNSQHTKREERNTNVPNQPLKDEFRRYRNEVKTLREC